MFTEKNIKDLLDAENILHTSTYEFYLGTPSLYKSISIELRKLLCDANRGKGISLLQTVFSGIKLNPLIGYSRTKRMNDGLSFSLPFQMKFDGKGNVKVSVSLEPNVLLPVEEWLDQEFVFHSLTLRKFIKAIADTEGAHSDPQLDNFILRMNSIKIGKQDTYKYLITAIGEYIGLCVSQLIEQNNVKRKYSHLL